MSNSLLEASMKRSVNSVSSGIDEILNQSTQNLPQNCPPTTQIDEDEFADSSLELDSECEQMTSTSDFNGSTSSKASNNNKRMTAIVNPFAPSSHKPRMSFERRRWAHAFALASDGSPIYHHWTNKSGTFMRLGVAWKSLTTPACLPLVSDKANEF